MSRKDCPRCGQHLPAEAFGPDNRARHGLQSWCRTCWNTRQAELRPTNPEKYRRHDRNNKLFSKYRIREAEYDELLLAQSGVCAICGKPETRQANIVPTYALAVDHCHATGKVRGLLCKKCNLLIGYADECPNILTAAIAYIERATGRMSSGKEKG